MKTIVSLATYKPRYQTLIHNLESIVNQTLLPDKIIVNAPANQPLPNDVIDYINSHDNLIHLNYVETDLKSHNKYFYSFQTYPNDNIILFDDDIKYNKKIVKSLVEASIKYPNMIIGTRGHKIILGNDNQPISYNDWGKRIDIYETDDPMIFNTSGAGTLYPPVFRPEELFNIEHILNDNIIHADDIWLWYMAKLANIKTILIQYKKTQNFTALPGTIKTGLWKQNIHMNDTYISNLTKMFNIDWLQILS